MDMQAQILDLQQQVSSLQAVATFHAILIIGLAVCLLLLSLGR
ncbi:hypothetical protein [uncultured Martelella sp.]|nr:hypothetical protein [uncultured Martelella sp.]